MAEPVAVERATVWAEMQHDGRCRHFRKDGEGYDAPMSEAECSCGLPAVLDDYAEAVREPYTRLEAENRALRAALQEAEAQYEAAELARSELAAENRVLREALRNVLRARYFPGVAVATVERARALIGEPDA